MFTLGMNAAYHDSAACLVQDGVPLAAVVARAAGAFVIGVTDQSGGKLTCLSHLAIRVPANAAEQIEQVEDAHLMIAHSLCVTLRARLQEERSLSGQEQVCEPA